MRSQRPGSHAVADRMTRSLRCAWRPGHIASRVPVPRVPGGRRVRRPAPGRKRLCLYDGPDLLRVACATMRRLPAPTAPCSTTSTVGPWTSTSRGCPTGSARFSAAAAANIRRQTDGNPPRPFRYRDPGSLATIGFPPGESSPPAIQALLPRPGGLPAAMFYLYAMKSKHVYEYVNDRTIKYITNKA